MKIENNNVLLKVNLTGGSYTDFHFKDLSINTINWHTKESEDYPGINSDFKNSIGKLLNNLLNRFEKK